MNKMKGLTHLTFNCSKSTIETLEKYVSLTQEFSCEYYKIFKSSFFNRITLVAASITANKLQFHVLIFDESIHYFYYRELTYTDVSTVVFCSKYCRKLVSIYWVANFFWNSNSRSSRKIPGTFIHFSMRNFILRKAQYKQYATSNKIIFAITK